MDNRGKVQIQQNSVAGRFSALKWTFTHRLQNATKQVTGTVLLFGSGPYINVYIKRAGLDDSLDIGPRLLVFDGIGAEVRGVASFANGFVLAWGDSYIAHITFDQLLIGGTVCQRNILSTGRLIVAIRTFHKPPAFTVYYSNGTLQAMKCEKKRKGHSMKVLKTCRLPLKPREMVTAACTKSSSITYLGTNLGRLVVLKDLYLIFITDPVINSPMKQIVILNAENPVDTALMRFENGSIASWKGNNKVSELKGRFTYISEFNFELNGKAGERHVFAGDMDGNVTVLQFDKGNLEIYRTIKGLIFNEITVIERMQEMSIIAFGGNMGEIQLFNVTDLAISKSEWELPPCIVNSDCYYRICEGWAFILNDSLFTNTKMVKKSKKSAFKAEHYCKKKKMKLKYYCCTGTPDREIILAYNKDGYYGRIHDFTKTEAEFEIANEDVDFHGEKLLFVNVIIMQSYILLQASSGRVLLLYIDSATQKQHSILSVALKGKVTTAACIERNEPSENKFLKPIDMMVGYLDGRVEVIPAAWNADRSLKIRMGAYSYLVYLQGGYLVSIIYSSTAIGKEQAILLSNKGIAYLAAKKVGWPGQYSTPREQDLRPIIGRGHSLLETTLGILAVGFKLHTLNVCHLKMAVDQPCTLTHILSVDTKSSRLPFTIIEEKRPSWIFQRGREGTGRLLVSYQRNDGIKREEMFNLNILDPTLSFSHTGIISHIFVNINLKEGSECYYTGDTHGRFCLWSLFDYRMSGQGNLNNYKLNGAVTGIREFGEFIAVSMSQGYLHIFQRPDAPFVQLLWRARYHMGQKISCITVYGDLLVAFLKDGTAKQVKMDLSKLRTNNAEEVIIVRKVAIFPCSIKMAMCTRLRKYYYITALGTDNICRRMQLSPPENETIQVSSNSQRLDQ